MTLENFVFRIFKTISDILLKIKKFAFLEYHKLSVQILEILNKNKENRKMALSVLVTFLWFAAVNNVAFSKKLWALSFMELEIWGWLL